MVSMSGAMSAGSASSYFEKDNYYIKDGETEKGNWNGTGAERLGLAGEVTMDQFKALEHGYDPSKLNAEHIKTLDQFAKTEASLNHQMNQALKTDDDAKAGQLSENIKEYNQMKAEFDKSLPSDAKLIADGKNENGMTTHRAGFDITFSASKSASITALVLGDKDVIEAHKNAMNTAMNYVQENFAQTRVRDGEGGRNRVNTGELTYAQFNHYTSRSTEGQTPDPQLHTHNMIFNVTHNGEKAMSLEPQQIYAAQKLADQIYQNEFARGVENLGYGVTWNKNGDNYTFEIKGIPQELIDHFSKRDAQITDHLATKEAELGRPLTEKEISVLKLETRSSKEALEINGLKEDWNNQTSDKNFDKEQLMSEMKNQQSDKNNVTTASEAVNKGVTNLDAGKSVFTNHEILFNSLKASRGTDSVQDLRASVNSSNAVSLDKTAQINSSTALYTSQEILKAEGRIFTAVDAGKGKMEQIMSKEDTDKLTSERVSFQSMTQGQQESAKMILTTTDRFTAIQGAAGSGKTTMLAELKDLLDKEKGGEVTLIGLAPTGKAASEIQEKGIESRTIDSFLKSAPVQANADNKQVWIVDEASMIDTKKLEALADRAEKVNARVVLIGDTEQLKSVGAGDMFSKLQESGKVEVAQMNEAVRQNRAADGVKDIVATFRDIEKIEEGMNKLAESGRLIEAKKEINEDGKETHDIAGLKETLKENAIKDYTEKGLNSTIVLTSTNAEKRELNASFRSELQENGTISKDDKSITMLEQKSLNSIDAKLAMSYQEGDVLISKQMQGDIKAGMRATVTGIDKDENKMQISYERRDGTIVEKWIDAETGDRFNAYRETEKQFAQGDKITFTKNDKDLSVKNGETAIVKSIDEEGKFTVNKDGKEMSFDSKEYQHVDHAYAMTTYKSQGQSVANVHIFAMSDQGLNTHNAGYVQVSRTTDEITLYTDNKEVLTEKYSEEQLKTNASDYKEEIINNTVNEKTTDQTTNIDGVKETAIENQSEKITESQSEKSFEEKIADLRADFDSSSTSSKAEFYEKIEHIKEENGVVSKETSEEIVEISKEVNETQSEKSKEIDELESAKEQNENEKREERESD